MSTNINNKIKASFVVVLLAVVLGVLIIQRVFINPQPIQVIVINKCDYNISEFWEAVKAGLDEAVVEYDVEVQYIHAGYEYEIEAQKNIIDEAIRMKPDLIVLSASDYYAIGPYAEKITKHNIDLLLMDSDANITVDSSVPFVGTNSLKAGKYLGEIAMSDQINSLSDQTQHKNAIVLVHYQGVQTSDDRENGIRAGYNPDMIYGTYSCDSDETIAYDITKEMLTTISDITIVFATNEVVTIGAAKAIDELGLKNEVHLYGFDGSKKHIQYLESGVVDYTVIQSPYQMGYLALKNGIELTMGEDKAEFIETDFLLISKDNMYDVGIREILFPFVNKN